MITKGRKWEVQKRCCFDKNCSKWLFKLITTMELGEGWPGLGGESLIVSVWATSEPRQYNSGACNHPPITLQMRLTLGIVYCSTLRSQLAHVQNTLLSSYLPKLYHSALVVQSAALQPSQLANWEHGFQWIWRSLELLDNVIAGSLAGESCQYGEYNSIIRIFTKTAQNLLKCHFFSPLVVLLPAPLWCEAVKHSTKLWKLWCQDVRKIK